MFIDDLDYAYEQLQKDCLRNGPVIRPTRIGGPCFLGYGRVVQAGTRLGDHCIVGANSVVHGESAPYSLIVGNPARTLKVLESNA